VRGVERKKVRKRRVSKRRKRMGEKGKTKTRGKGINK